MTPKFWILQEHLRDIRDDPEVLDPPKHSASAIVCVMRVHAIACTRMTHTDVYTIYSMQVIYSAEPKTSLRKPFKLAELARQHS